MSPRPRKDHLEARSAASPPPKIDRHSATPPAEQLRQQIRRAIADGSLRVGAQLVSVRQMSDLVAISPTTVQKVYADLARDGLIHGRAGLGIFVSELRPQVSREQRERILSEKFDAFLTDAALLGLGPGLVRPLIFRRLKDFGIAPRTGQLPSERDAEG